MEQLGYCLVISQRSIGASGLGIRCRRSDSFSQTMWLAVSVLAAAHVLLILKVSAQDAPAAAPGAVTCSASTCFDCVTLGCAWFPSGSCYETCSAFPTEACYSTQFYSRESPTIVCNRVQRDAANDQACSVVADCAACLVTIQLDGATPCSWYEAAGTCGSGACTFTECGTLKCPGGAEAPTPAPVPSTPTAPTPVGDCILNATSCEDCLQNTSSSSGESANACAWVAGVCVNSCSDVPGVACYSASAFPDYADNATALCALESLAETGCGAVTNCTECTKTLQEDGQSSCLWYEKSDSSIVPYCGTEYPGGNCDLNGICGVTDCSRINDPTVNGGSNATNETMGEMNNKGTGSNSSKPNGSNNTDTTSAASMDHPCATALHAIALFMAICISHYIVR
jgi:hypothetical protein